MSAGPFTRPVLWAVIGVAGLSLVVAGVLALFGDELGGGTPAQGADTYSKSAIGHAGLVALLEGLDIPVVRSRDASAEKARSGLLVVAEPSVSDPAARQRLEAMLRAAPRALLVLPKWFGRAPPGATWIEEAELVPTGDADDVMRALGITATVRRSPKPALLESEEFAAMPQLRAPQLVETDGLDALVTDGDGHILLGHGQWDDEGNEVWVLTDPDVLNNHGLRRPENARFIIEVIDRLRDGGPVVFDEIIHGYAEPPSLVRTLFRFPIVLATLQVLICALLAVWAAMVRFGPRRAAPPPFAPGKDFLIRNTAALLHYGGHHGHALRRYLAHSVAAVRHALHAPQLADGALAVWLDRVGAARGATDTLGALEQAAAAATTPHRTIEVADRVYRWRMEMTHGARDRS